MPVAHTWMHTVPLPLAASSALLLSLSRSLLSGPGAPPLLAPLSGGEAPSSLSLPHTAGWDGHRAGLSRDCTRNTLLSSLPAVLQPLGVEVSRSASDHTPPQGCVLWNPEHSTLGPRDRIIIILSCPLALLVHNSGFCPWAWSNALPRSSSLRVGPGAPARLHTHRQTQEGRSLLFAVPLPTAWPSTAHCAPAWWLPG